MNARNVLIVALLSLAALYAFWFAHDAHPVAALLVFALPPALCAIAVATGRRTARWTGGSSTSTRIRTGSARTAGRS